VVGVEPHVSSATLEDALEAASLQRQSSVLRVHLGSISPTCLRTGLTSVDHKCIKRQLNHQCPLLPLGSAREKATCKMLLKLPPDEDIEAVDRAGVDSHLWPAVNVTKYLNRSFLILM